MHFGQIAIISRRGGGEYLDADVDSGVDLVADQVARISADIGRVRNEIKPSPKKYDDGCGFAHRPVESIWVS